MLHRIPGLNWQQKYRYLMNYLNLHLIPKDRDLWTLDRFEDFIEARKQLILDKFDYLIFEEQEEYATS